MQATKLEPQTIHLLGSTVHYWVFHPGKPTVVVALHGFRGTHHGLQQIVDALPDIQFIVPDLPGFGGSTPMTRYKHDIEGYKEFAKAFIKRVAPDKPVLLGHSFGSTICAAVIADMPRLVSKAIFVNPIAFKNSNWFNPSLNIGRAYYWLGGKILAEKPGLKLLKSSSVILLGSIAMAKTKDKALRRAIHAKHITYFGQFQGRQPLNEAYAASVEHSISEYTNKLNLPILMIAGAADVMAPLKGQYRLQKLLPDARLVVIPGVGHLIHYETPGPAAAAISKFLAS
jgi:pimeloyl-ACP methyl ester carboxylesterase